MVPRSFTLRPIIVTKGFLMHIHREMCRRANGTKFDRKEKERMLLKILSFVFLLPGVFLIFAARFLVSRYKLDEKVKCDFAHEMDEDGLKEYKMNKAVLNVKMFGMLVALPGFILILLVFK